MKATTATMTTTAARDKPSQAMRDKPGWDATSGTN
jgi:hypothetical protein